MQQLAAAVEDCVAEAAEKQREATEQQEGMRLRLAGSEQRLQVADAASRQEAASPH